MEVVVTFLAKTCAHVAMYTYPGYQVEILVCTFENGTSSIPVNYANIPNGYITNVPRVVGGCAKGDW